MNWYQTVSLVVLLATGFLIVNNTNTQDTTTPTPAPSKTPITAQTNIPQTTPTPQTASSLTLTQDDLSVITGNTQRPNGLTWYNNKLYTVCSGDSTIYEIDASTGETNQYIYGVRNAHTLYATSTSDGFILWIPDFQTDTLLSIEKGVAKNIATGLSGPWGITPINQDTFIITNLKANSASLVSTNGEVREAITNLRSPTGIAANNEYVFIANTGSARRAIEWFPTKQITNTKIDAPLAADKDGKPLVTGLQNVTGITLGSDGLLYFAYALGTRGVIGRVNPNVCITNGGCSNDQIEIVVYTELAAPLAGLTLSPDMKLFIHSMFSPDLYWVQLPTGQPQ